MTTFFTASFDGLPRLEKRLRAFRFVIKNLIAEAMKEAGEDVLKTHIQEKIIEGDYLFKANKDQEPNLLDSITITVGSRSREITLSVGSTASYAEFFEVGRPAGKFPDGEEYELQNITQWLIDKKGVEPILAPTIAFRMVNILKTEDDAFRFPDPVIGPAAAEVADKYIENVGILLNLKVERF